MLEVLFLRKEPIVINFAALKEIEVTGEKQQEAFPEARRNRRISKSRRKAEFEGDELKVQCRDLAPADYEGWLFKKCESNFKSYLAHDRHSSKSGRVIRRRLFFIQYRNLQEQNYLEHYFTTLQGRCHEVQKTKATHGHNKEAGN